ncbi:PAS domain S-box protein [Fischerella sp. PCC 9605]|uniref:PAS domain S-box protein n=1 Tax=Fischerella sp. PCC 9605 TaxID=1173024 RepID=UPI00047A8B6B|nr:PAS domain S-box protein [Fischerella sp. PCC 9605]
MMKLFRIQKLAAVFLLALAVVFANAAIFYSNTMKLIENQQAIAHSHTIIIQLERVFSTFQNAETAQRNYLITTDPDCLQAYVASQKEINTYTQYLKNLTADNPIKQTWFFLLEQKITHGFSVLEEEVNLGKTPGFGNYRQANFVLSKQAINEIQKLIDDRLQVEQKLLQQQINQSQVNFQRTIAMFALIAAVDLLLVGLLYYLLRSYINRLKQTEQALRQSEHHLRAIIDAEPESIKLIAKDGTLVEINTSGVAMMEVESADVLIGKPIDAAIAPEYQQAFRNLHESVCQGNKGTLEFEIVGCKGTRRWMETHAVPLPDETDGTFMHLAVTRDITRRKQAEQKIREQAALLDVAMDAILIQGIDRQILFWNKGAERLYGWKFEEAIGKKTSQLLYKETSSQLEAALLTVFESGSWQGELQQVTKAGAEIIVESRWTLVRDDKGKPKSILTVNTEITQKKQLEAQLLRSQRLESIGTLAGGIAHDLNNVLAPILMSVQLLKMKLPDSQYQQLLEIAENNSKRGANLVKQLLSFARGIESTRTIVQVGHLIAEIEQIITQTFPKSITCHTQIPENLCHVYGDPTQLHQVLMNLVVNARDAMPNGGILSICAENLVIDEHDAQINIDARIGAYIAITIADTGVGMPLEIQERMFEPFFTTKEVGKGTGLGLSTVIGIIKNHGGFLNVFSQVGQGTQFKVFLPCLTNSKDTEPPAEQEESLIGCGELILVVDDEIAICKITKSSLENYNYRVLTANDGVEALTIYAQHQQEINVVLLDMMMPGMDGALALRKLQQINPNVKIIATSGLLSEPKIADVQSMGVKAFLSKPCTANELLQTLNEIICGN